jgi:galactokinase/mevalonate kinase-like predicted kinase
VASNKIITDEVAVITDQLENIGCLGYKLLGAGGGGFVFGVFEFAATDIQLKLKNWHSFRPSLDAQGARIVSVN